MKLNTRMLLTRIVVFAILIVWGTGTTAQKSKALGAVYATVETAPTLNSGDSSDDMAIWIHPTDPSLSTIIGTDKVGNLEVYDLSGAILQRIPFLTNNVDLRYNFPLGGEHVALVTGVDRTAHKLFAYKVNPETRLLEDVSTSSSLPGLLGSCMYVSPITGKYYAFTNLNNVLKQYELVDNGSGRVAVTLVRTITFGSFIDLTEGVTADDIHSKVYVSEEAVAIWKLGAEPTDGDAKVMVDKPIAEGGHFEPDIEGLTIYYKSNGTGYLIGSSQGNSTFNVYTREGNNDYLGTFNIVEGTVDGVNGTDGIDVTNFPLGPNFPQGVFIAQDGRNTDGSVTVNKNFKLVPFESIAGVLNLTMDTSWDPRLVGAGGQPTPTVTSMPTNTANTETATALPSPTGTMSQTHTSTATETIPTLTQTATASPSPTATATNTATSTRTVTATRTPTPTSASTAMPDLIFANGFESGDLSAWSSSTTDAGDLSASSVAALIGGQGMQAVIDDNNSIYVNDDSPNTETRYRARLYFDPNSIRMANNDAHYLMYGYTGPSTIVMRLELRYNKGNYQLRAALRNDGGGWNNSSWFTMTDVSHFVEIDWRASTSVGANNGGLTLWIDNTQRANLTGVDNDTRRIDRVQLGAVFGVDIGTRGTYYFDAFESRRQAYIGP